MSIERFGLLDELAELSFDTSALENPSICCYQIAKLTCGKPLFDEREAVSWPSQFNVTARQRAALTGELHRQWSRFTGALCQLKAC